MSEFKGQRSIAVERLNRFLVFSGDYYSKNRNYDLTAGVNNNVSMLSPFIRTRLITESEVISKVLSNSSVKESEKFIQEVIWRTYWKGWLEMRPVVWDNYLSQVSSHTELSSSFQQAIAGETGIRCFDFWCEQLKKEGYLHNHARMWFASIWIFTLKLPWYLGANFFLENLLDGCPASNTLSWRWVAGMQTKGKFYLASASNIKKFTKGYFDPEDKLAKKEICIEHGQEIRIDELDVLKSSLESNYDILMVHEEDLHLESFFNLSSIKKIIVIRADSSSVKRSKLVNSFINQAIEDQILRLGNKEVVFEVKSSNDWKELARYLRKLDDKKVCLLMPFVGELKERLVSLTNDLTSSSIEIKFFRRKWDSILFPYAKKGFFSFKKAVMPELICELVNEC